MVVDKDIEDRSYNRCCNASEQQHQEECGSEKNQVSQSNKWATLAHISENVNTKKTKFVANRGA